MVEACIYFTIYNGGSYGPHRGRYKIKTFVFIINVQQEEYTTRLRPVGYQV